MEKNDPNRSATNLYDVAERIVNALPLEYVDSVDYIVKKTKLFVAVYRALSQRDEIYEDQIRAILDTKAR